MSFKTKLQIIYNKMEAEQERESKKASKQESQCWREYTYICKQQSIGNLARKRERGN